MTTISETQPTQTLPGDPPVQGRWRKLRSGEYGVEVREAGFEDLTGRVVEITRRSDGAVARMRLAKLVSRRRGKLAPLYAIERIPKEGS